MTRPMMPDDLVGFVDQSGDFTCILCLGEDTAEERLDDEDYTCILASDTWRVEVGECVECGAVCAEVQP